MYKINYFPEVRKDFDNIPNDVLVETREYIKKFKVNPYSCSLPLYGNLSSCRKVYIANANYRIVIQIEKNIAQIVEIVAVGKRENKEVYKEASERISNKKS
jgi:mRNA interferase RelE/StbE